jgi:hypothetical protein
MAQTPYAFDPHPADPQVGFDIGWDHAHHGRVPPPQHLHLGNPVRQGWQAGRACFGARTLGASRLVRQWLQLRLQAWRVGRVFEREQVTPHYLGQLDVPQCPVTRQALGGGEGVIARVHDGAGYAAGNLAMMASLASRAKGTLDWQEALGHAQRAGAADGSAVQGLNAAAWSRLAVLMSFVSVLPHAQAACLPLLVQPPNRLRVLNPVQGLQALVTRELGRPDGTRRLRALAELLPGDALRLDFNLFLSALLPRLIEAGQGRPSWALRHALEDAWRDARVNRCWQRFALQLDESLVEALLQQCAAKAIAGTHLLLHARATATEGWALATRGLAQQPQAAGIRLRDRPAANVPPDRARIMPSRSRVADGHLPA